MKYTSTILSVLPARALPGLLIPLLLSLLVIPSDFALQQSYPNRLDPITVIRSEIPVSSRVTLKVHNMLGQEVATLVDEIQEAGVQGG